MTEEDRVWRIGYCALYLFGTACAAIAFAIMWGGYLDVWKGLFVLLVGCVLIYLAGLWHGGATGRRRVIVRRVFAVFFAWYALLLVSFTFLDGLFFRGASTAGVNLLPLRTIRDIYLASLHNGPVQRNAAIINLAGNLLLLAPLAVLAPLFCRVFRRWWAFVPGVMGLSALIEVGQLLSHRGCCDIDDLILNTAGACAVYFLLKIPPLRRGMAKITMENKEETST